MSRTYVVGNWKMNGAIEESLSRAKEIADYLQNRQQRSDSVALPHVVLCPSYHLLPSVAFVATHVSGGLLAVGAQDCHHKEKGAYTGDISPLMIKDCGCSYTLVGHSERRQYHHETDALIHEKILAAHGAGLVAILCVGETKEAYDFGTAHDVLSTQLRSCLPLTATPSNTIIAYEPVWSIGTGLLPTLDYISSIHQHIQTTALAHLSLTTPFSILYGGSVNPSNSKDIIALPSVSGVLVGGASLVASDFISIIESC